MVSQVGIPADLVADAVSTALLLTTADGAPVWNNQAMSRLFSWVGPEDVPFVAAQPGGPPVEVTLARPQLGPGRFTIFCQQLGDYLLYEVAEVFVDVSAASQRASAEWLLTHTERIAKIGTWEWDLNSATVRWSPALLERFGLPPDTIMDYDQYRGMMHPDDVELVESTLDQALRENRPFAYTVRMYLPDRATLRALECFGEVISNAAGTPVRVFGLAQDITELRAAQAEAARLADHDPLTGLLHRRVITHRLGQLTAARSREGAALIIDVDNFQDVNDVRGHGAGDELLRRLARLLTDWVPPGAVVGRLGGDEFAVILPKGSPEQVMVLAEELCDRTVRDPMVLQEDVLRVTLSIGVAPLDGDQDAETLLAQADLALSQAKKAGRNRAAMFAPEQYQHALHRLTIMRRARAALDNGRMELDAQPIIDLTTGQITSFELLVRLRDGIYPEVGPEEFLPTLERGDLVRELDRWVIEQAIIALARPAARFNGLHLDVNISCRSMDDPGFGTWVVSKLRQMGVDPSRLGLEITETMAISNLDAAKRLATTLTSVGCRFGLDDFGAGFGSFVYLKHLPFTTVKIAREFVQQADRDGVDAVLVEAVVRAANGLGMTTVAEHVDREPLVTALRQLGVTMGQGFHLGTPVPLRQVLITSEDAPTQLLPRTR